jgi:alpha-tubulin suppressor-like RCC1 family protein
MGSFTRQRHLILASLPLVLATVVGVVMWIRDEASRKPARSPIVAGPAVPPGRNPMQLALGYASGFFLDPQGELWGWGLVPGLPPIGATAAMPYGDYVPQRLAPGTNWIRMAFGSQHLLLIRDDRTLWGLGYQMFGELGEYPAGVVPLSPLSTNVGWTEIGAGQFHSAGLKSDGTLWTWGGGAAQLRGNGIPAGTLFPAPAKVGGTNRWHGLTVGDEHTIALANDGSIWSWNAGGTNPSATLLAQRGPWKTVTYNFGTLGALDDQGRLALASLPGFHNRQFPPLSSQTLEFHPAFAHARWDRILTHSDLVIARQTDGTWWGLGDNHQGELGLGDRRTRSSPTRLTWPPEVVGAALGQSSAGFILTDASIWLSGATHMRAGVAASSPVHDIHEVMTEIGVALNVPGSRSSRGGTLSVHPTLLWTWPRPGSESLDSHVSGGIPSTAQPNPPPQ